MTEVATVKPHLERRFQDQRVVFWHDPEGQYAAELDGLDMSGVTILLVGNDEYAIKYRLLKEQPDDKVLVYRSGPIPVGIGNWLLDLELAIRKTEAETAEKDHTKWIRPIADDVLAEFRRDYRSHFMSKLREMAQKQADKDVGELFAKILREL